MREMRFERVVGWARISRMQDQLEARIRDVHKMVRRYDDSLKELKAYFDERPNAAAQALLLSLSEQLDVWRQYALSRFGVDQGLRRGQAGLDGSRPPRGERGFLEEGLEHADDVWNGLVPDRQREPECLPHLFRG